MTAGVFVVKGAVKEDPGPVDGGIPADQGTFTQIRRALIHGDHPFQRLLTFFRFDLHGFPLLKPDGKVFDQAALPGKGFRRDKHPFRFAPFRAGEDLLGGDVRVEDASGKIFFRTAGKDALLHQPDTEIRAVAALIFQCDKFIVVQGVAALVDDPVVFLPVGDGIAFRAGGSQDRFPQLFHRLLRRDAGKDFACPFLPGYTGNTPLETVFHGIAVGLDLREACHLSAGALALIDPVHTIRIIGIQPEERGQFFHAPLEFFDLPILNGPEFFLGLVELRQFVQGHILPIHRDFCSAGAVTLLCYQTHKFRLIQSGKNDHFLTGIRVQTTFHDQFRVCFQTGIIHKFFLLAVVLFCVHAIH